MDRPKNGPISSELKDLLLPDYVGHYKTYIENEVPIQDQTPMERTASSSTSASHDMVPVKVGKTEDITIPRKASSGDALTIRCLTPIGEPPSAGWPVVVYFHGGGWRFGDLGSEMPLCTRLCQWTEAVVITTDYR